MLKYCTTALTLINTMHQFNHTDMSGSRNILRCLYCFVRDLMFFQFNLIYYCNKTGGHSTYRKWLDGRTFPMCGFVELE